MESPKLFMLMLGCTLPGRHTEQHDIFFTIADSVKQLKAEIMAFWPEAGQKIHIDAWREVNEVDGYQVSVVPKGTATTANARSLFFLNLGGYRPDEFDEPHYKMLVVAETQAEAIKQAKKTAFYKHATFAGATSHVDNKYGVDVDDMFEIADILAPELKSMFDLQIEAVEGLPQDEIHLGYFKLSNLD